MKVSALFSPLLATAVLGAQGAVIDSRSVKVASDSIKSFTYGGSGCPGGSVSAPATPEYPSVALAYSKFTALTGGNADITASRKNCQINIDYALSSPTAGSLIVRTVMHVELAAGVTATQRANYYVSGSTNQQTLTSQLTGPLSKDFVYTDTVPLASFVTASDVTGGELPINIDTSVNYGLGGSGEGVFTIKSTDVTLAPRVERLKVRSVEE